jgi:hypothetical protein
MHPPLFLSPAQAHTLSPLSPLSLSRLSTEDYPLILLTLIPHHADQHRQ